MMARVGEPWDAATAPFIEVRLAGAGAIARGSLDGFLGHRIEQGRGRSALGNWVEWRWDGDALTLTNDRFGGYPVYYAASATGIAVSPSIERLLELDVDRSLDLDALAAFLAIGYYLYADTPFRAIRALPPAATLHWQAGRLSLHDPVVKRPQPSLTRRQAIEGLAELVRDIVRRQIPDDAAYEMPISGGRDSRHLLLELIDAGHPPSRAVTAHHHPIVWGGDVPYAAGLCAALGIPHHVVSPGPLVADEWRKNRLTSYCSDEHAWYLPVADTLNGRVSHTYDGLHGGSFTRYYYTPRIRKLDRERRFEELSVYLGRKQHGQPRFAPLVSPAVRELLSGERAASRICAELERHADQPEPFLVLRSRNRTARELNLPSTLMLHGVPSAFTPFMDPELVEFAWHIPTEHIDEGFHSDVIAARFPLASAIPYRPKTQPTPGRGYLRQMNRDLLDLLRRHSDGSLVDRGSLVRRAAIGAATGSEWFAWGRRAALTTYLVQLEGIAAGRSPTALSHPSGRSLT